MQGRGTARSSECVGGKHTCRPARPAPCPPLRQGWTWEAVDIPDGEMEEQVPWLVGDRCYWFSEWPRACGLAVLPACHPHCLLLGWGQP